MNGRLYDRSALDNELKQVAEQVKLFRPGNN